MTDHHIDAWSGAVVSFVLWTSGMALWKALVLTGLCGAFLTMMAAVVRAGRR